MKFISLLIGCLVLMAIVSSCSVQICHPNVQHCHYECYDYCCDRNGCWDCDCHEVCRDDCYLDQPDAAK